MEDLRKITVYEIQHRLTKLSYIGATYNGVFSRVGHHFYELMSHRHRNKLFQAAWNNSDITDWDIRILEYDISQNESREREEYWITKKKGLNIFQKSGLQIRDELYQKIAVQIKAGMTYRMIAEKHKVSLGTVTNVARKFKLTKKAGAQI